MNVQALRHVRKIFSQYNAPEEHRRSYQRQWVRQVRHLGDKWLLAKPQERTNIPRY